MKYKYDKLAHPAHEVRIAILEPGAFDDAIIVRFMSRNLQVCNMCDRDWEENGRTCLTAMQI